ncbi:MAG: hypothetical protein ABIS35_04245 [Terracoccus sp.]
MLTAATLDAAADEGLASLTMDGHWALQLASKFDGIIDISQTTRSGSHQFRYPDIMDEFTRLERTFSDTPVVLIHGANISSIQRNRGVFVTIADPGGLRSRADALAWCADHFPEVTYDRINVCYPRRLRLD